MASYRKMPSFNRTFMELKEVMLFYRVLLLNCFNRTFMELKAQNVFTNGGSPSFQSHLYGIESPLAELDQKAWLGFNRTFMELKAAYILFNFFRYLFQSHLYGIESEASPKYNSQNGQVSIAPLWN